MEGRDVNWVLKYIAKQAERARKEQLAEEKARDREAVKYAREVAKREAKEKAKQKGRELYTAVIITRLEYKSDDAPSVKQLADELRQTINGWVGQKGFTGIDPRGPVPTLVCL